MTRGRQDKSLSLSNATRHLQPGVVLIVDGDPQQAHDVRSLAQQAGLSTREFASLEELQKNWDWSQPSCLITDLRKFGTNGRLRQELGKESGPFPAIILSGHHVSGAAQAAENRSFRWLPRPLCSEEALQAIRRALDRDRDHHERLARVQALRDRLNTLTPQERQVLDLVMAGRPNKAIASALDMAIRTVELRRQKIARKMQAKSLAELILMVAEAQSDEPNGQRA